MSLASYLKSVTESLRSAPRTKEEIFQKSRDILNQLNVSPPSRQYKFPLSVFLLETVWKNYLHQSLEHVKIGGSVTLPHPSDEWYGPVLRYVTNGAADLSVISMPMVYRVNPSRPASCCLLVCHTDIEETIDTALRIVRDGCGVGIEMLYTGADLIRRLHALDVELQQMPGLRDNFISVNVLACHPDVVALLQRCAKSCGLFFNKINIGLWWSPKFMNDSAEIRIVARETDLLRLKMNPENIDTCRITSKYTLSHLIDVKIRGGIPYLMHIEANEDYGSAVYGTNLCTEISLPVAKIVDGVVRYSSHLCILCNIDCSRLVTLTQAERNLAYGAIVDIVSGVWDSLVSSDIASLVPNLDVVSRPCGIGMTGLYSAACESNAPYTCQFVVDWLTEFMDGCRRAFAAKEQKHLWMFSMPPSSNSEYNMMCSPNVMHWPAKTTLIISSAGNFSLSNPNYQRMRLSYTDKVVISSMFDQSMSLDHFVTKSADLADMIDYMATGCITRDGIDYRTKTISYYTRNQRQSRISCAKCDL